MQCFPRKRSLDMTCRGHSEKLYFDSKRASDAGKISTESRAAVKGAAVRKNEARWKKGEEREAVKDGEAEFALLSKSRKVRKREEKNSCDRMHEEKVRSGAGVFHFSDTLWADLTE
ncbi:MAG: hypothetical protein KH326_07080 [Ruminococcus callidus]|uniref:hypothetical protein n=1 Tax=Ruminococcus callidus TaxID=40519 RepID=UPI0023F29707|nr:hypothetical protein [Ruminococcus callidus]MBS6596814.1 hypothetical protein [Ruminococcus callidus]